MPKWMGLVGCLRSACFREISTPCRFKRKRVPCSRLREHAHASQVITPVNVEIGNSCLLGQHPDISITHRVAMVL